MNSVMQSMGMPMGMGMSMAMPDPFQMINSMPMMPFGGTSSVHHHHHITPYSALSNTPSVHSYSHFSSSVITNDEYGRPQIYETTAMHRSAPGAYKCPLQRFLSWSSCAGGVRETRSTMRDSRTGMHQMSIGHHIHDRAHIRQRSRNYYTGTQEHNDEYINLAEEEAPEFNREWQRRAHRFDGGYSRRALSASASPTHQQRLALPPSSSEPTEVTTEPIITEPDDEEDVARSGERRKHDRTRSKKEKARFLKRARHD